MNHKKWIITLALFGIIVCFTCVWISQSDRGHVIATVNGEDIYQADYSQIRKLNETLSEEKAIEIIMKEVLVYQEANKVGINVLDREVEERIVDLKNEIPDMYKLCIEKYGSEEAYREALYYLILYEKMYDYISGKYINEMEIDEIEIRKEMNRKGVAENYKEIKDYEISEYLQNKYREEIYDYFMEWNNEIYQMAEKEYME